MINAQIIASNGLPQYAVVPYQQYLELVAKAEGFDDVEDYLDYQRAEEVLQSNTQWHSSDEVKEALGLND